MTITVEQHAVSDTTPTDGWQAELAAIRNLESVDVSIFERTAADVDDELSELRQALAAVSAKVKQAELRRAAIDDQLGEVFRLAALVRQTLDTDSNFAGIYGNDAEAAIKHVRSLSRFTE